MGKRDCIRQKGKQNQCILQVELLVLAVRFLVPVHVQVSS